MRKILFTFCFTFMLILFISTKAYAITGCQPIYGGGETCTTSSLSIEKSVFNPQNTNINDLNAYVHNLGMNDAKYQAGFNVTFHIKVSNMTNQALNNIQVTDIFPQFVNFASDLSQKQGLFNLNNKTWTATINSLPSNGQVTYILVGRIVEADQLPKDQSAICVINQARAITPDSKSVQDTSQLCIKGNQNVTPSTKTNNQTTKGGLPTNQILPINSYTTKGALPVLPPSSVTTMPPTGPEILPLLGLIPTGIVGFYIRKIAKK